MPRAIPRKVVVLIAVLAVLAALGFVAWRQATASPLRDAVEAVPQETARLTFTDWAAVRERVGEPGFKGPAIQRFIGEAYDLDLTAASSIDESAAALQKYFGFSPANADWEAFAQSTEGATMVLQLPSSVDMEGIEEKLEDVGFGRPSSETGVWTGGVDLVAGIDPTISPELQYVVVLADEHRVVTSDTSDYAAYAARAARGLDDGLLTEDGVADLVGDVEESAAATMWAGDFACEDLAMSRADTEDQARADGLIEDAGGVSPLNGLLMSMQTDRDFDVVLGFENPDQAERNLRPRAALAVGEAVGRGDDFADSLELTRSRTSGRDVVLTFEPQEKSGFVLSDVNNGPVLFATC